LAFVRGNGHGQPIFAIGVAVEADERDLAVDPLDRAVEDEPLPDRAVGEDLFEREDRLERPGFVFDEMPNGLVAAERIEGGTRS
jgi:hypothetical protein